MNSQCILKSIQGSYLKHRKVIINFTRVFQILVKSETFVIDTNNRKE